VEKDCEKIRNENVCIVADEYGAERDKVGEDGKNCAWSMFGAEWITSEGHACFGDVFCLSYCVIRFRRECGRLRCKYKAEEERGKTADENDGVVAHNGGGGRVFILPS
jgi:hypothetical protein